MSNRSLTTPFFVRPQFCSVIVALSGIETIAKYNLCDESQFGIRLKETFSHSNFNTSHSFCDDKVIAYTTLFGLAAAAIGNFQISNKTV